LLYNITSVCVVVGLSVVLLDVPLDIVAINQLFWTWHDTDPNLSDRHYHVPWVSYYFHASFAAAFTALFSGSRDLISDKRDADVRMQSDGSVIVIISSGLTFRLFRNRKRLETGLLYFN